MDQFCQVEWDAEDDRHACMYLSGDHDEHVCTCGAGFHLEVEIE